MKCEICGRNQVLCRCFELPAMPGAALAAVPSTSLLEELEAELSTGEKDFSDAMQAEKSDQICGFADGYVRGLRFALHAERRHSSNAKLSYSGSLDGAPTKEGGIADESGVHSVESPIKKISDSGGERSEP